jgi:hypothetical protein
LVELKQYSSFICRCSGISTLYTKKVKTNAFIRYQKHPSDTEMRVDLYFTCNIKRIWKFIYKCNGMWIKCSSVEQYVGTLNGGKTYVEDILYRYLGLGHRTYTLNGEDFILMEY